jgi:hypothetical protein
MMKFCQVFWLSCLFRNDEVLPGILTIMFIQKWWSSARYFDYHVYTEMMKFCQVFCLSCLYRNDEVLPGILTIMFIQKWWSSARYFDYHVYTDMMKFCQVFWLSCVYRNAELRHFCINMIVKIPGRTSSFLYKHDSQNTWQNFVISV